MATFSARELQILRRRSCPARRLSHKKRLTMAEIEDKVRELFPEDVWKALSVYEKSNYSSQFQNFTKMREMGKYQYLSA